MKIRKKDVNRFFENVFVGFGDSACWTWLGGLNMKTGRGTFWVDGETRCASRVGYKIYFGGFDSNLYVCHHCDNPNCVNPSHLFLGTNSDNMKDMYRKNRRRMDGENAPNSTLTNKDVKDIRKKYWEDNISQKDLSSIYGVDRSNISRIVNKESFKEIS